MPWVPRELYDVMLEALRERGAVRVHEGIAESAAAERSENGPVTPPVTSAPPLTPPAPPTLSDVVAHACVRYAYGSRDEEMANRRIAYEMTRAGQSNSAIIATLRDGASLPAWADTL